MTFWKTVKNFILQRFASIAVICGVLAFSVHGMFGLNPRSSAEYTYINTPSHTTTLDFSQIEIALSKIRYSEDNGLILNSKAESALSIAAESHISQNHDKTSTRVNFLIQQSFPGQRGHKILGTYQKYLQYKIAEKSKFTPNQKFENPHKEKLMLAEREALQNKILGKTLALQLYGEQRSLLRKILNDRLSMSSSSNDDINHIDKLHHSDS